jgi:hypothetical protein
MQQDIKAIETLYKGYRFRSRLEARWAVFFDSLAWNWSYELEGYKFADGTCYLPDFYLPDLEIFVEIKGQEPTAEEYKKADNLKKSGKPVLILVGPPWAAHSWWFTNGDPDYSRMQLLAGVIDGWTFKSITAAQLDAKQARFEHGENGTPRQP